MACWEVVLLALLAVAALAAVWLARHAWHQFRCPACRAALRAVRERHPDWRMSGAEHRASEPGRDVVAVFYTPPEVVVFPAPYQLVAVSRNGAVEELPDDPESPYFIRGRK